MSAPDVEGPFVGMSMWSAKAKRRVRFCRRCLKHGRKMFDRHEARGKPRLVYPDSLEALNEKCEECGDKLQGVVVPTKKLTTNPLKIARGIQDLHKRNGKAH